MISNASWYLESTGPLAATVSTWPVVVTRPREIPTNIPNASPRDTSAHAASCSRGCSRSTTRSSCCCWRRPSPRRRRCCRATTARKVTCQLLTNPISRSTRSTDLQLHPVLGREDTVGSGRGRDRGRGSGSRRRHCFVSESFKPKRRQWRLERERGKEKRKETEKISQFAVSRDPTAGLATRQRPPPPPCLSSSTSAGVPSTEETGVDAAMQSTCQRANAQRAEQHTHRLCISRGRTHSDPLREWSGPRLTCKRARAKIRFGGPGQRRPRQSASGQGF